VNGSYDVTPFAEWEWALQQGSFEEVHATLEAVVAHLERGSLPLSETVACYELGVLLADRCERFLSEAELRISEIEAFAGPGHKPRTTRIHGWMAWRRWWRCHSRCTQVNFAAVPSVALPQETEPTQPRVSMSVKHGLGAVGSIVDSAFGLD
jgi:exodeoxyribonuclease VII small subunit